MLIRLNKFLAESDCCSRRKADEYILAGDVSVNGSVIKELGVKVDEIKDTVEFKGKPVKPSQNLVYYAVYKPKGVVSTVSDEKGRESVVDLVPHEPRVYPVGRLDLASEGLMILTNDGELTQKITHPSFEHEKEYEVEVRIMDYELWEDKKNIGQEIVNKFTSGIIIEGKRMFADKVSVDLIRDSLFLIHLSLHTGYNRQIRRMCDKIGLIVKKITRTRIGKLRLDSLDLSTGEYKKVSKENIL